MVSINGLPPALVGNTKKTQKKAKVKAEQTHTGVGQPTKVANAVAHTIRQVDESELHRAELQYDLPEGRSRKAMEEYMGIMNQAKREELMKLMGVDIYI